ncbi:hypothetical protein IB238_11310 [Rhizobium sp. ARZ01]|nr:hypothetical protein [Rhizobium sp. ARZ01]
MSRTLPMTNLTTFSYLSKSVRVVEIDGQPWFVAADVCRILYGRTTGLAEVYKRLDDDEQRIVTRFEVRNLSLITGRGAPAIRLLSEPGLYKLIQSSSRPEAKAFDRWVRHEVLPAIRKDGMYVAGEEKLKTGEMDEDELTLLVMDRLKSWFVIGTPRKNYCRTGSINAH